MPSKSPFPDIDIPDVDLWGLLFSRQNRDFPDDKVIYRAVNSDRKYTFADVKAHATLFGEGLRDAWDWQKDDILALFVPNDIDVPPVIYGTFFAGGVVTLANPAYSADELAFQLENSGAKALVTTRGFLDTALKAAAKVGIDRNRVILLGAEKDTSHRVKHWTHIRKTSGATHYGRRKADPEDLAFLAYSSGTTGLPKGVMLSHRNIVADLLMIQGAPGQWYSPATDKFLGVLPFFHIYGLTGLVHQMLHRGIELVVMPAFDMQTFLQTIQDCRITCIYVAPPIIVRLARDKMVDKYDLSSVKMITSGAAPLTQELVDAVHTRLGIKINQAYGLSETSPMTHAQPWNEWHTSIGSVGKLFPNMTAKYMSPSNHELGPGTPGELWLRGPNVFAGYWRNAAATASSLTPDGFFKTGDIGFQDAAQNFYITDRVKELIKYKGFQVAPAELEGKLMLNEGVADVAVIGVNDEHMHTEVPRAYVVLAAAGGRGTEGEARRIVEWVRERVANHKRLRGGVVFVDEVPKSASGKILRRVLKERSKGDVALGLEVRGKL
ncbi:acetyl-CoA synthetase-like protein [Dothidotthia symphoricarpi CBS 119687]|uniref:Acetyl-CoA synthetase-like protein n=1 Tax=Dothidotthia symphoricarpi CBS 119687 TaxID=1392245 RepID=A0A6A6AUQ5_9PLEO|nr:acetyl-CoA synthetase-like protein [Dothidotthia symphoricarpi CBS 119687]KAF2134674.1 acetyl-CoA synthetase-like protein [Dothidotthia symphoricarpi CBS 119687]